MKKKWLAMVCLLLLVVMTACGSSTGGKDSGKKNSNQLTVYSPNQTEIINPIVKEFQDRTGIKVDIVTGGTGQLLNRIKAESANPLGDVLWGGGVESLDGFKDYFAAYTTKEDAKIDEMYKSPDHKWTGFSALPMVIMYNKDQVKDSDAPKSWNDLLNPKWKGKIAYADPAKSGSSYTQLVTMLDAFQQGDEKGWDYVKKFMKNLKGKILDESALVFKGVADGEFPIGVTLEDSAYRYIAGGSNVGIEYPSEGTSMVPDGAAIIKGAKNSKNAQKFIDFIVGKDVQQLIVKDFNRRSVRDDVDPPKGLKASKEIKVVDYDLNWSASHKEDVIKKFQDIRIGK
ncbi:extracellular solute-binding protein [Camelliibacillus cellulosilyticus]|uniref:Extracellular solute-binding protein n=1 Tax=Camelliibacillus cellulosilyticus TaxID=2174486 RepID=A0ABV9GTT2_9BACL